MPQLPGVLHQGRTGLLLLAAAGLSGQPSGYLHPAMRDPEDQTDPTRVLGAVPGLLGLRGTAEVHTEAGAACRLCEGADLVLAT